MEVVTLYLAVLVAVLMVVLLAVLALLLHGTCFARSKTAGWWWTHGPKSHVALPS